MSTITTNDGTEICYKDWGSGPPVVFSHGWPLNADAWESQMVYLASSGYRCIAHDRRGHGRSSQPWNGNEMDTYADDLATLIERLDLNGMTLVGHSTGGGEVARYIGRRGTMHVAKDEQVALSMASCDCVLTSVFRWLGRAPGNGPCGRRPQGVLAPNVASDECRHGGDLRGGRGAGRVCKTAQTRPIRTPNMPVERPHASPDLLHGGGHALVTQPVAREHPVQNPR
jgi:pimeloyl-ACP methyl ester carboxylesterase